MRPKRLKYLVRGTFHNILYSTHIKRVVEGGKTGTEVLVDMLPTVFAASLIIGIFSWLARRPVAPKLWIQKGKVVKAFSIFQAIRIVRKHNWKFVEAEPVRHIDRWIALKILINGDRR